MMDQNLSRKESRMGGQTTKNQKPKLNSTPCMQFASPPHNDTFAASYQVNTTSEVFLKVESVHLYHSYKSTSRNVSRGSPTNGASHANLPKSHLGMSTTYEQGG